MHIFPWHLDDIFHATSACRGNSCWHGLLRDIILLKEPGICKMRLNPCEWFETTVYLPFPASIEFQTLIESGGENPVYMEPWLPEQQLVGRLGVNYMEIEDVDRSPITSSTRIIPMAR